jgi:hypothetical protein
MSAKKAPKRPRQPKRPKQRRKKSVFWRALRRWLASWFRMKVRNGRARVKAALGPKTIATASSDWVGGENLRPRLQPYPWRHYVAPDDVEVYEANIGGYEFEFELMPESGVELEKAAYDAAADNWGPFVDSQPLYWIRAVSDAALNVLPEPIKG